MSDLHLHGIAISTYTRSARMMLIEKGLDFAFETVDLGSPELKALHPFGKIPILRHGDLTLFETIAIGRYVDEAFDGPPLQPSDPAERAVMSQWASAIIDYVYPALIRHYLLDGYVRPKFAGQPPNRKAIEAALPDLESNLGILEEALSGRDAFVGDRPNLADYLLLPILHYMQGPPESAEMMGRLPGVSAWLESMSSRPSAQQTVPPSSAE